MVELLSFCAFLSFLHILNEWPVVLESEKKSPKMHYLLVTESPTQTDLSNEEAIILLLSCVLHMPYIII